MSEPSLAKQAWINISDGILVDEYEEIEGERFIQSAIDQACAQKDQRIAELEAQLKPRSATFADLQNWAAVQTASRADLFSAISILQERLAAMSAILDGCAHEEDINRAGDFAPVHEPCLPSCARCQWEALKAEAQQFTEPRSPDAAQKQGAER
jgi:hypothetical protein